MATATQTIELVGGPRDGEIWVYEYTGNPAFGVDCMSESGISTQYNMCSDGRFRPEHYASVWEKQQKKAKKKK